ncbi:MAG: c-type cytochrome [Pedosphaera sp.]|nr:c-type cytochrome [Pedosphaera sp.]
MTIRFHLIARIATGALLCSEVVASAQSGDKANELQREIVPRELIPPAPVLSAEDQLKTFRLPPGFRAEIVASEPLVTTPVTLQFDHRGRLWVLEMNGYIQTPDGRNELEPAGNVVILEDTDGDGRMDRKTVFLDRLVMPRALMLAGDGAIVAEPPNLWYCRDTNGDGRCDQKELLTGGYAVEDDPKLGDRANPEHSSNSLVWALDNWIYSANHTTRYRVTRGFSATAIQKEETVFRGQWGLSQDDYGRLYHNSNSDQLRGDLVPSHYLARNPNLRQPFGANVQLVKDQRVWPIRVNPGVNRGYQPNQLTPEGRLATFIGACGPVVYRGDQFPDEFRGDVFLCEPTVNVIRRNRILEKNGSLTATNAYDQAEFLASTDERFRPVNLYNGPDGALYVVDIARGLIQHRIYLTSYLRKQTESRNLQAPDNLGRIYRIVHDGRPVKRKDFLPAKPTTEQLLGRVSHPNGFWRDIAQQMLIERRDADAVPRLRKLTVLEHNPAPLGRLHALWTLEGLNQLDLSTIEAATKDPVPKVRSAVFRLSEAFLKTDQREEAIQGVLCCAGFVAQDEQLQLLMTLGEIATPAADTISKILLMNGPPSQLRFDATISGLRGRELEFLESLVGDPICSTTKQEHAPLLFGLAKCVTHEAMPQRVERLLELTANLKPGDWQQIAILDGVVATQPIAPKSGTMIRPLALNSEPRSLAVIAGSGDRRLQERAGRLLALISWPGKAASTNPPPAAVPELTAVQQASQLRGKELYTTVCGACHQPHGNGQPGLAPPLRDSEWSLGSEQRLIRIALHGMRDAVTVKGEKWELSMPTLAEAFDDQQVADVLTYIRREWGHTAPPVAVETVAVVRALHAKREDAWTEAELLKIQ